MHIHFVHCFRYPSLKNVRELLYKHGHGSVDGRRTPLTSNADIEKVLGMFPLFCAVIGYNFHCLPAVYYTENPQ